MSDQLLKTIGGKIEGLRMEHKISRETLQGACGLKEQSIKKIERNPSKTFDVSALCSIADYFDVDVDYLLGRQEARRKVFADVSAVTGLSYEAANLLSSFGILKQSDVDTLSTLICSPSFLPLINLIKRYCLLEGESKSMLKEGYSNLSDREVMIAAIQNNVSLLVNEAKSKAHDELMLSDKRERAFALIASALIKANSEVSESKIRESLAECGLDADKEIQAFHEYFSEYKKAMKGRE